MMNKQIPPAKCLTDPNWKYTSWEETNIRETFERIRQEQELARIKFYQPPRLMYQGR